MNNNQELVEEVIEEVIEKKLELLKKKSFSDFLDNSCLQIWLEDLHPLNSRFDIKQVQGSIATLVAMEKIIEILSENFGMEVSCHLYSNRIVIGLKNERFCRHIYYLEICDCDKTKLREVEESIPLSLGIIREYFLKTYEEAVELHKKLNLKIKDL